MIFSKVRKQLTLQSQYINDKADICEKVRFFNFLTQVNTCS